MNKAARRSLHLHQLVPRPPSAQKELCLRPLHYEVTSDAFRTFDAMREAICIHIGQARTPLTFISKAQAQPKLQRDMFQCDRMKAVICCKGARAYL